MRIIGGSLRSRKLEFPDADGLRPTADRIRETLFNWLQDKVAGETCLDLFAGSGAIGFEAISRGAKEVVFIEKNAVVCDAIAENIRRMQIGNAEIVNGNALHWLGQKTNSGRKFGLVFLDPPFGDDIIYQVCAKLAASRIMKGGAKIYIESGTELDTTELPSGWIMGKNKRAGSVRYYLFTNE